MEECSLYLEGCILNLNGCFDIDLDENPEEKLKKVKYQCKAHMQICALLSQLHKHKEALVHAEQAIKLSHYLIKDIDRLLDYYKEQQRIADSSSPSAKKVRLSQLGKTAVKLKPIVEEVISRLLPEDETDIMPVIPDQDFSTRFDKVDMRNLLGYLN